MHCEMDLFVLVESKGFPDASTIKLQTKPGLLELCFYQSFFPCCGKMCDHDVTLRDCCFASDRAGLNFCQELQKFC